MGYLVHDEARGTVGCCQRMPGLLQQAFDLTKRGHVRSVVLLVGGFILVFQSGQTNG